MFRRMERHLLGLSPADSLPTQMAFSLLFPPTELSTYRGHSICLLGSDVKMHPHPLPPLGRHRPSMPLFFLRLFPDPFLLSKTQSSHECPSRDSGALTLAGPSFVQLSFHWEQHWQLSVHSGASVVVYRPGNWKAASVPCAPQDLPHRICPKDLKCLA